MLVLSRKLGEKIYIDDSIAVTVVRIDGNRVALGFEAPHDVRIMRSELTTAKPAPLEVEIDLAPELVGASL